MLSVLINERHGGFRLSAQAIDEYNRRKGPDAPALRNGTTDVERTDPLMVRIVKEMDGLASGAYAKVVVEEIPAQYVKHFRIVEYDGWESIQILHDSYALDQVRSVLDNEALSVEDKLVQLRSVVQKEAPQDDEAPVNMRSVVYSA